MAFFLGHRLTGLGGLVGFVAESQEVVHMPRTLDMFAELKPPRKPPSKLMHVCDANGCCEEDGTGAMVRMRCKRCGYESQWLYLGSVTEAKRGKPCPDCNKTS
jgi:hypothetical protein